MPAGDFLPPIAEGLGGPGLFLYLMRTVLSPDRPLPRGIKEIQKRLDAERTRSGRVETQLRTEREKTAKQFGLQTELDYANQRAERFATENSELHAEIKRLKGGGGT